MESLSMQKEPPNSPLVHTKSKWKKEWPQWGKWGGFMEGDDRQRYIYVCVKQKQNKKSGIFMLFFRMYIVFFSFTFFHFT